MPGLGLRGYARERVSGTGPGRAPDAASGRTLRQRLLALGLAMAGVFSLISAQLVRLGLTAEAPMTLTMSEPVAASFARPDIVDRNGRLVATDLAMPSLFADPGIVLDRDELVEALAPVFPDLDTEGLRRSLAEPGRRFVWVRRGVSPRIAQRVHDLGLPGLEFRSELRRAYPLGETAGHLLGGVNADNKGLAGIERYIDDAVGVDGVHGATLSGKAAVRLSLDLGAQHSLESELATATRRFRAEGAAGLVMDVRTGEIVAASSTPGIDPLHVTASLDGQRPDRVAGGVYELGSIFKMVTVAMALDKGAVSPDSILDVTEPLDAGGRTVSDLHPAGRPLTVSEVFIRSSNVGAGLMALAVGPGEQKRFLDDLGLMSPLKTEQGPVAPPLLPRQFGRAEQITISYGHGLAVAPLQFAAAAAALVNGGEYVAPTYLSRAAGAAPARRRVVSAETSARLNAMLRRNVTDPAGTGRRADVPGYDVGGKTGTAEIAKGGSYRDKSVISSFVAAFPMKAPRYLVMVSLFEPEATEDSRGEITAGLNAAPTAGRIIARIAPQLGVLSDQSVAEAAE